MSKPKQQDDGQAGALPGLTIEEMTRLAALGSGDAVRMQCRAEEGRLARARSEAERIDRIVNSCGRCSTPQSNHVAWARCGGTPSISVPRNEPRFREKESQVFYFLILGDPVPPGRSQLPVPDRKELGSLLASLGAATCAWQQVEFSLYLIFQYAIGSPHRLALSAAFHEVRNFNNRLSMVNSALAQRFPNSELLRQWQGLSASITTRASARNKIAHSVLYFEPKQPAGKQVYLGPSVATPSLYLEGPMYKKGKLHIHQRDRIYEEALMERGGWFLELHNNLFAFLRGVPNSPLKNEGFPMEYLPDGEAPDGDDIET